MSSMINPLVTTVTQPLRMAQGFRSTPMPALRARRPPGMWEEPLFRDRWPSEGPYQGTVAGPFEYGQRTELTPIQFYPPDYPRDGEVNGLEEHFDRSIPDPLLDPTVRLIIWASTAFSAYHGYKRNDSVGWAMAWGLGGALFPIIMPVIALAQGYAKPAEPRAGKIR
jgi:hypothetical protein